MILPDGTCGIRSWGRTRCNLYSSGGTGIERENFVGAFYEKVFGWDFAEKRDPDGSGSVPGSWDEKRGEEFDGFFVRVVIPERKIAARYWVVYEELKYSDLFAPRFKFFVENRGEIAGKKYEEASFRIIRTMLSDHLINNTTGRITSKENPWNCGEANEMPSMRSLIKISDLSDKEFFLVWCDLAEACYFGQADQVKEYIRKMTTLPEAMAFGRSFVWAFQQYFPDEKGELTRLRELWNLDENNYRKR